MIAPVSFRSVQTATNANFSDKLRQPQAYVVKEEPTAASSIQSGSKKSKAKKVLGVLALAGAVVGALALGAKTCKLADWAGNIQKENSLFKKALNGMDAAGNWICAKAESIKTAVLGLFQGKGGTEGAATVTNAAEEAAEAAINAVT